MLIEMAALLLRARGCLETVASLRGLVKRWGMTGSPELDLTTLHAKGSNAFDQWVEQAGTDLGRVLAGVSNVVDVSDIIINGLLPPALLSV